MFIRPLLKSGFFNNLYMFLDPFVKIQLIGPKTTGRQNSVMQVQLFQSKPHKVDQHKRRDRQLLLAKVRMPIGRIDIFFLGFVSLVSEAYSKMSQCQESAKNRK